MQRERSPATARAVLARIEGYERPFWNGERMDYLREALAYDGPTPFSFAPLE